MKLNSAVPACDSRTAANVTVGNRALVIDASQVLGLEQETEKLRQALATLKPEQREIIEQAYLGELTHQEISARTGLPLGTIKSRIRLGMERLRHELKELKQ